MLAIRPVELDSNGRVSLTDFRVLSPWWEARGGGPPSREMLPSCGAIAEKNGEPVACAFLYLDATGSGVAWLSWLATRPATSAHLTGRALFRILDFLKIHARSLNYWLITASYHHPSLISMLKRLGFKTGDTGMTHLFKTL